MNGMASKLGWVVLSVAAAIALAVLAVDRGENVNAAWVVIAALGSFLIGYRFYSRFVAYTVVGIDPRRTTPAVRHNDGLDYVPTDKYVLFGHHFAAIAGAGPLVGPVLAAQMGYLPGVLWLIAGGLFAGAIQDFVILFASVRRDGRSLGDMIRTEMGPVAGALSSLGILAIMIILLAVLALIVVKALVGSPWGTFTVAATIPIALLMGIYGRYLRPGRIGEMSVIGLVLLLGALIFGQTVAETPVLASMFTFTGVQLSIILMAYGFIASVLPVWLILAPRDYLSTFLKIGTILSLAFGICIVLPVLKMPAMTRFVDGTGPSFAGSLFPFLFITIACGAVSGFHALIASGTTPKMVENEAQLPFIGYGAMLAESFVGIMALIAASVMEPGIYFALNSPAALIGTDPAHAAEVISNMGFAVSGDTLTQIAHDLGETTILSRTGGAPTLAVGMAQILSGVFGGTYLMAFWYHFAILFEALFILTTIDAGTRVCRFMFQDALSTIIPAFRNTQSWGANVFATALAVGGWGYFLYQGVTDPLGGINTLWPLFGIANQMLASMALILATVILFKMKREKFAWVTWAPTAWLLLATLTAGWEKLFSPIPAIGFLAHRSIYAAALEEGKVLAPAKSLDQMQQIVTNDTVDAALCGLFILVVLSTVFYGIKCSLAALSRPTATTVETPYAQAAE